MTEDNSHTSATRPNVDASILRERISRAIFEPGATEGNRGQRTTTDWQTDAVMRVLGFAAPTPSTNVNGSAEAFDKADWYWRTLDPDDCGDSPEEALNTGMVAPYCVCEVGCSYVGPTRFGFIARVLDPESDDEEFLHFETQDEAVAAANERRAAIEAMEASENDEA